MKSPTSIIFWAHTATVLPSLAAWRPGTAALKIDPELASGYRGLALNLNEMGRLREALPAYLKAVTLNPSYGAGLVDFAHGLATAGRYDESLDYAQRARRLNPNSRGGAYHQGVALVLLDDDARSERFLTAAAARSPNEDRLQILLAFLDLRRGRPQAAVDRIRATVEKRPGNIEGLLTRAEIETFAGAPDAPGHVASLFERAADGLVPHRALPGQARPRLSSAPLRGGRRRAKNHGPDSRDQPQGSCRRR